MDTGIFQNYFYFRIIRKIVTAFGSIFNDIQVVKYNQQGTQELERVLVPITYSQKEKFYERITIDPNLTRSIQVQLPRMAFELEDLTPDISRRLNTNLYNKAPAPGGSFYQQRVGSPWNFKFSLLAYVRNIEDGAQIAEQVLGYFNPDYTLRLVLDSTMGFEKDVPVILDSTSYKVQDEGSGDEMRTIIWQFDFTVKGWLYQPILQPSIIKQANTNIYDTSKQELLNILSLSMHTGGFGTYQYQEFVYQGNSLDKASALGQVVSWDALNNILYLNNTSGLFESNVSVLGAVTNADFLLNSYVIDTKPVEWSVITPNPPTANGQGDFGFTVSIFENLNVP